MNRVDSVDPTDKVGLEQRLKHMKELAALTCREDAFETEEIANAKPLSGNVSGGLARKLVWLREGGSREWTAGKPERWRMARPGIHGRPVLGLWLF